MSPSSTLKKSTLTIRIDQELKDSIMKIAHESGEDISTWIRRFFENIREQKKGVIKNNNDEIFSEESIKIVLDAQSKGSFHDFDINQYV
jgi:antitoxin component of RelBE/YafQ-DinJ toxin-antitoxin module